MCLLQRNLSCSVFTSKVCIVSEATFKNNKKGHVISLYRSLSRTPDQFDNFLQLFEELLHDIFKINNSFILITGDFNCRNSNWYLGDPVTPQGARVEALTSFSGLNQLIKTSTRLL